MTLYELQDTDEITTFKRNKQLCGLSSGRIFCWDSAKPSPA